MSEVATSPAPVAAAPTPEVASPTPDVSAEPAVSDVAESPEPAGDLPEATTESAPEPVEAAEVQPETPPNETPFDPNTWDGNIDALPEFLKGPVQYLHRNLESGYTKKFQDLSEQRKTFESERDVWGQDKEAWELNKADVEAERDLLKQLLEGHEDPRVGELTEANKTLKAEVERIQSEHADYQRVVTADIEKQAREYADRFKAQHKAIFSSDEKRQQLSNLLGKDWNPEMAVKLVGVDERAISLATELRDKGTPEEVAVEHALLKIGRNQTRTPRPAARITSGAESRNNPESAPGGSNLQSSTNHEARQLAAREALNWAKSQKLT